MIATPDYDAVVIELGDPAPLLAEIADEITDPPRITDDADPEEQDA